MNPSGSESGKSILIVDDEEDVRTVLATVLTLSGYAVTEAADGREAVDILGEKKFDLVFLDLMMPRMTGEEVLEYVRRDEKLKDLPVIILTAKGQRKEIEQGYEKGATFYVVKPFSNSTIRDLARYVLEDLREQEREQLLFDLMNKPSIM
jgi:two-component system alkaline phosphatase synthesis response regulator PhoP